MTEAQWLACNEPEQMLRFLLGRPTSGWRRFFACLGVFRENEEPTRARGASDQKLRLYAAACCRSIWELLKDGRSRDAVKVCERHANGDADPEELAVAHQLAWDAVAALRPTVAEDYFSIVGAVRGAEKLWYWAARAAAAATMSDAVAAARETDAAVARTGVEWAATAAGEIQAIARVIGSQARAQLLRDIFGNPCC